MKPLVPDGSLCLMIALLSLWTFGCRADSVSVNHTRHVADSDATLHEPETGAVENVSGSSRPDALELVSHYNSRDLGSPGWRRVSLELINDSKVSRAFTVVNLWDGADAEVRTLFHLEEPRGLQGTSYLLVEGGSGAGDRDIRVHLFLPAGERRVLEIAPNDFEEGLLGSDFTSTDLRMRLPTKGYHYRLAGRSTMLNEPAWVIEAMPSTDATRRTSAWSRARFYLAQNFAFLLGADYFDEETGGKARLDAIKRMRVNSLKQIDGVWTAMRITMSGAEKNASVLTLKDARFRLGQIDAALLTPEQLPSAAERLRKSGWAIDAR